MFPTTPAKTGFSTLPTRFPVPCYRIAMIPPSIAALTNARKPGFSAFIFSDVKTPTGGNSAEYKIQAGSGVSFVD